MSSPEDSDHDDAAEQLLAVSAELGDTEHETGWRSRSGTVRRRQRVVRGAAPQDIEIRERVKVRTVTEEGAAGQRPTGPGPAAEPPEPQDPPAPVMLDAQGNPIAEAVPPGATAAVADAGSADAGRYLADAVRSYLDGVEQLGAEHAVTLDRLAQMRRTLERFERS